MFVVADADALIALADQLDELHNRAKKISQNLLKQKVDTFFPITAISEALKTLQSKPVKRDGKFYVLRPDEAKRLVQYVQDGVYPVLPIDEAIFKEALKLYKKENFAYSRGNTMFDAIIATVARQLDAAVFSFDGVYKRMRLPLAEDLFQ